MQVVNIDTGGILKVQLVDDITLKDNTAEKLNKKLKIVSSNQNYSLGNLVKTTSDDIMFDVSVGGQTCYFSAIGKRLARVNNAIYVATAGTVSIDSISALETFRDNVNNGNSYSGSTVNLTKDIDLQSVEAWDPIGLFVDADISNDAVKKKGFSGAFDGGNHIIKNLKLAEILVKKVSILKGGSNFEYRNLYKPLGLFGNVVDGSIKNLCLNGVTIKSTTETPYPAIDGMKNIGCLVGGVYGKSTVSNIKLTNATITVTNTNELTKQGTEFRFEYGNNTSAGGIIGCIYATLTSANKNQTEVDMSYIETSSTITITGNNGCYTNAGGIVGEVSAAIYVSSTAGGYRLFSSVRPKITINNCLTKSKMVVIDQQKNKRVDLSYGANFGGVVGRLADYVSETYSDGCINISNCISMIDPSSSVTNNTSAGAGRSYSHPIFSCGESWNNDINQYLINNYYIKTNFKFSSAACAEAKNFPT